MTDEKNPQWWGELLRMGGSLLTGFILGVILHTYTTRRRKPTLGIQVNAPDDFMDWAFELVIENHWDTELKVSDIEFHFIDPEGLDKVVRASEVPRFEDRDMSIYGELKPPPYWRLAVEGKKIGQVTFELIMLARRVNYSIKAVVLFDHLDRKVELGRKHLRTLTGFLLSFRTFEERDDARRNSL